MNPSSFKLTTKDKTVLHVYKWEAKEKRAIIVIAHGMAEHSLLYNDFASFLASSGFVVYSADHRGHGKTAVSIESVGYLSDSDGWNKVVSDIEEVRIRAVEENKGLPVIMLGHSMGSLLIRTYITRHGDKIKGAILSGTTYVSRLMIALSRLLIKIELLTKDKKQPSPLLDNVVFGSYNKKFKPNKTKFDWISRDVEACKSYEADPFCGFVCSVGFYKDLADGLELIISKKEIEKIPKDLPLYIYSGSECPVGGRTKKVMKVIKMFKQAGIKNIEYKFYEGARHVPHNEINKKEVYQDVVAWINKVLK